MAETTTSDVFSAEEKKAMRERAKELKAATGKAADAAANEHAIAKLPDDERELAERIRTVVVAAAPHLDPKTYYGFPAWARDGKVVCFFKDAGKFGGRFATFGFEDAAKLDEESIWVTSYAIAKLTDADVKKLSELVKRAAG